mmetsp:Transcript_37370/g.83630  ORF Transcript_37370/g.83630 Transcript_37370/m.83630 type:complete len:86 (+) Transcript_37370:1137-1394(+)
MAKGLKAESSYKHTLVEAAEWLVNEKVAAENALVLDFNMAWWTREMSFCQARGQVWSPRGPQAAPSPRLGPFQGRKVRRLLGPAC